MVEKLLLPMHLQKVVMPLQKAVDWMLFFPEELMLMLMRLPQRVSQLLKSQRQMPVLLQVTPLLAKRL